MRFVSSSVSRFKLPKNLENVWKTWADTEDLSQFRMFTTIIKPMGFRGFEAGRGQRQEWEQKRQPNPSLEPDG